MLPGDLLVGGPSSHQLPPDDLPYDRLLDFEQGGAAISDPSKGLLGYIWSCRAVGDSIQIRRGSDAWAELLTFTAPYEIAFTFDQNMRPLVAIATRAKALSLYWYDPVVGAYTVTALGTGRCPRMALDDKRPFSNQYSDAILGYVKGNNLVYRQQRDRFLTEYHAMANVPGHAKLKQLGMCSNLRVQFTVSS
ncbi:hypothetical protein UFOVP60_8 [uncultured Caudovirales phage]|uniref:Uncharacterized protein n=1 Tax=uncultured Caudovirales phage TaxID=2100421 RepID=A0A6J5T9R2_9CAUD|nr:hypothetical protein UFOVP60_8 [uncultured Caudovirales phage]